MPDSRLLTNFNFEISLLKAANVAEDRASANGAASPLSNDDTLGDGGFQECSGLEIELDVQELLEGGRNDGVIRQVGRAKFQPLILKRGLFYGSDSGVSGDLWIWLQGIASGVRPVVRYDGIVSVFNTPNKDASRPNAIAKWVFDRALPIKIRAAELNAKSGDILIEELHIAHEGLRLRTL